MASQKIYVESAGSCHSDIFNCDICYDKFTRPRILPCLHSFCEPCLQSHVTINTSVGLDGCLNFSCPTCRERVTLPADGVSGFRLDFRVTKFQDLLQQNNQTISEQDLISCQFCPVGEKGCSAVQYFCKDCCKFLCLPCTVKHREKAIFREHQVQDLHQTTMSATGKTCQTHRNEVVQYVCLTCHASICALCVMTSFHDDHNVLAMTKGLQHYVDNFTQLHKDLVQRSSNLQQKLTFLVENEESVRIHREQAAKKIKDRVDSLVDHLQRQERRLLNELDKICTSELDCLVKAQRDIELSVSEMQNVTDLCGCFAQKPPLSSMVPIYGDLCERIEKLLQENKVDKFDIKDKEVTSRSSVEFTPGSNLPKLGCLNSSLPHYEKSRRRSKSKNVPVCERICATGILNSINASSPLPRAQLKVKFGQAGSNGGEFDSPRDVAFLSNGSFVVADTNNNRVQLFSANGLLVNVIGEGQIKPWGVCVTHDSLIALTDNLDKCIKLYRPNGVLVSRIGRLLCPCGIAVTKKGHFVVTDFFSTYGYVLDHAGGLIQQFEVRSSSDQHTCGASRIAVDHHGNMVISDISNACLKVFDCDGKLVQMVRDHLVAPQGICFDPHSCLLLVADALQHQVMTFDVDGTYMGVVEGGKTRLRDATGLAVSASHGYMVVTQLKSNQLKLYYISYN